MVRILSAVASCIVAFALIQPTIASFHVSFGARDVGGHTVKREVSDKETMYLVHGSAKGVYIAKATDGTWPQRCLTEYAEYNKKYPPGTKNKASVKQSKDGVEVVFEVTPIASETKIFDQTVIDTAANKKKADERKAKSTTGGATPPPAGQQVKVGGH